MAACQRRCLKKPGCLGVGIGAGENVAGAVEHNKSGKYADSKKGRQLEDGFERNRCDDAFVTFCGIEMTGAEQDGEQGHQQSNIESAICPEWQMVTGASGLDGGVLAEYVEAYRQCFQLQGNVRQHTEQGDNRHQRRESGGLAVAGTDEIGDRGNTLAFGDSHHLTQYKPPEHSRQSRTEVNRQKAGARRCGTTDAAIIRPRRAINGQR